MFYFVLGVLSGAATVAFAGAIWVGRVFRPW